MLIPPYLRSYVYLSFRRTLFFQNDYLFIYLSIYLSVCLSVCLSMALQSLIGPWPLYQFLNPIHSLYYSLNGGSARRKVVTYTQNNANTE
jgi:hypothetical protein